MRQTLRLYLGETLHEIAKCSPTLTLLDWLRLDQRQHGTKEGCNEGDCGACTVVVGRLEAGQLTYRAVNACIVFLPSLDGCQIYTVEHLKSDAGLHPVQQAMIEHHASQCGFCTPGIVMSLFALWLNENQAPSVSRIEDALAGNLCRCTGYRPIIDATLAMYQTGARQSDPFLAGKAKIEARLKSLLDAEILHLGGEADFYSPATLDDLADLYAANSAATLIAGMTDVGLWVTKGMQDLCCVISLARVEALKSITRTPQHLTLGAMVPLAKTFSELGKAHPHIAELLRRFGSEQVRNSGTIGGNIANGSPIGDLPPLLIALGAKLNLRHGKSTRQIPLEQFFIAYKNQDRAPGEFIESVDIPLLAPDEILHVSKISKRFDEDISAICGAFVLKIAAGTIVQARLAFGGMAATPKRASKAEAALVGKLWSLEAADAAAQALAADFAPLSDWRASANYRSKMAANLLRRFALETLTQTPTRVTKIGGGNV